MADHQPHMLCSKCRTEIAIDQILLLRCRHAICFQCRKTLLESPIPHLFKCLLPECHQFSDIKKEIRPVSFLENAPEQSFDRCSDHNQPEDKYCIECRSYICSQSPCLQNHRSAIFTSELVEKVLKNFIQEDKEFQKVYAETKKETEAVGKEIEQFKREQEELGRKIQDKTNEEENWKEALTVCGRQMSAAERHTLSHKQLMDYAAVVQKRAKGKNLIEEGLYLLSNFETTTRRMKTIEETKARTATITTPADRPTQIFIPCPVRIEDAHFSPESGQVLIPYLVDKLERIERKAPLIPKHGQLSFGSCFNEDKTKFFSTTGHNNSIHVFEGYEGTPTVTHFKIKNAGCLRGIDYSPEGNLIVTDSEQSQLTQCTTDGTILRAIKTEHPVIYRYSCFIAPDKIVTTTSKGVTCIRLDKKKGDETLWNRVLPHSWTVTFDRGWLYVCTCVRDVKCVGDVVILDESGEVRDRMHVSDGEPVRVERYGDELFIVCRKSFVAQAEHDG